MKYSKNGYKRNSKDRKNPYNVIPSGDITMEGVDFPVHGTDNLGNQQLMMPGANYTFPGNEVFEVPLQHFPRHFQKGGEDIPSLRVLPDEELDDAFYDPHPLRNQIHINESQLRDGVTLPHEVYHWKQRERGDLFENPNIQKHPAGPVTDERLYESYNRREKDLNRQTQEEFNYFPESQMVPNFTRNVVANNQMYQNPETAEGEARAFESIYQNFPEYAETERNILLNKLADNTEYLQKQTGGSLSKAQNGEETNLMDHFYANPNSKALGDASGLIDGKYLMLANGYENVITGDYLTKEEFNTQKRDNNEEYYRSVFGDKAYDSFPTIEEAEEQRIKQGTISASPESNKINPSIMGITVSQSPAWKLLFEQGMRTGDFSESNRMHDDFQKNIIYNTALGVLPIPGLSTGIKNPFSYGLGAAPGAATKYVPGFSKGLFEGLGRIASSPYKALDKTKLGNRLFNSESSMWNTPIGTELGFANSSVTSKYLAGQMPSNISGMRTPTINVNDLNKPFISNYKTLPGGNQVRVGDKINPAFRQATDDFTQNLPINIKNELITKEGIVNTKLLNRITDTGYKGPTSLNTQSSNLLDRPYSNRSSFESTSTLPKSISSRLSTNADEIYRIRSGFSNTRNAPQGVGKNLEKGFEENTRVPSSLMENTEGYNYLKNSARVSENNNAFVSKKDLLAYITGQKQYIDPGLNKQLASYKPKPDEQKYLLSVLDKYYPNAAEYEPIILSEFKQAAIQEIAPVQTYTSPSQNYQGYGIDKTFKKQVGTDQMQNNQPLVVSNNISIPKTTQNELWESFKKSIIKYGVNDINEIGIKSKIKKDFFNHLSGDNPYGTFKLDNLTLKKFDGTIDNTNYPWKEIDMYKLFQETYQPESQMLNIKSDVLTDQFGTAIGSNQHGFPSNTLAHLRETTYKGGSAKGKIMEINESQADWPTDKTKRPGYKYDKEINELKNKISNKFNVDGKPLNIESKKQTNKFLDTASPEDIEAFNPLFEEIKLQTNMKNNDPNVIGQTTGILGSQANSLLKENENLLFTQIIQNAINKGYGKISLPTPQDIIKSQWNEQVYDTPELQAKKIDKLEEQKIKSTNTTIVDRRNNHAAQIENRYRAPFKFEGPINRLEDGTIEINPNNKIKINKDNWKFDLRSFQRNSGKNIIDNEYGSLGSSYTMSPIGEKYIKQLFKTYDFKSIPEERTKEFLSNSDGTLNDRNINTFKKEFQQAIRKEILNKPGKKEKLEEWLNIEIKKNFKEDVRNKQEKEGLGNEAQYIKEKLDYYLNWEKNQYLKKNQLESYKKNSLTFDDDDFFIYSGRVIYDKNQKIIGMEPDWKEIDGEGGGRNGWIWEKILAKDQVKRIYERDIKLLFNQDLYLYKPQQNEVELGRIDPSNPNKKRLSENQKLLISEHELFNIVNKFQEQNFERQMVKLKEFDISETARTKIINSKIKTAQQQIKNGDYPTALHWKNEYSREIILNRYTYPKLKIKIQENFPGYNVDDILKKETDQFGRQRFMITLPESFFDNKGELKALQQGGSISDTTMRLRNRDYDDRRDKPFAQTGLETSDLNFVDPETGLPKDTIPPIEKELTVPLNIMLKQSMAESSLRPDAVSDAGAIGLTQVMPKTLEDYIESTGDKNIDLYNWEDAIKVQNWYMNDLYNASFIDKPNQSDEVRMAKTLAAYNWGRGHMFDLLTKQKEEGIDIYSDDMNWIKELPVETSEYLDKILFNTNKRFNKDADLLLNNPENKEYLDAYDYSSYDDKMDFRNKMYESYITLGHQHEEALKMADEQANVGINKPFYFKDEEYYDPKSFQIIEDSNSKKLGGEFTKKIKRLKQQLSQYKDGKEISYMAKKELIKLGLIDNVLTPS